MRSPTWPFLLIAIFVLWVIVAQAQCARYGERYASAPIARPAEW
jgi:hypothetical protein